MKLLVVIVNYRTPGLTIDCLASLAAAGGLPPDSRVVVTDNLSGDDSVRRIGDAIDERGWQAWAQLMPLPRNGGFAYGNNEAIRPALAGPDKPEFVLLLNSDTQVYPGALQTLVDFLEQHPAAAMVGSRLEDPDGTAQASTFRFPSLWSELDEALRLGPIHRLLSRFVTLLPTPTSATQVDWVAGASLCVRREVFDTIGLLDDNYFLYYEETDFCLRAARAGFSCWYEPKSRVTHFVGQSTGVTVREQALPPAEVLVRFTPPIFSAQSRPSIHGAARRRMGAQLSARAPAIAIAPQTGLRSAPTVARLRSQQRVRARLQQLVGRHLTAGVPFHSTLHCGSACFKASTVAAVTGVLRQ